MSEEEHPVATRDRAEDGDGEPSDSDSASALTVSEGASNPEVDDFAAERLVLTYPDADAPIVSGESLRIPPGDVTALVGPNGSGKSTLLKGLADQLSPADGAVYLDGRDLREFGTKALARRLGLLAQDRDAPGSLTVEELAFHGRYPHRGVFEGVDADDRAAVERALALTGVAHLRDRPVDSLSGGQRQLAWLAMALAQETDILLLDEPTTFLDLHHQLEVLDVVETLRDERGITVVLVLHDVEQAARHADYMIALKDGAIHARGSPEDVVTEELLADVFDVEATVRIDDRGPRVTPLRPLLDGQDDT